MTIFTLPDLGEGLPDAEIREWYVKVGEKVAMDQPLVSMETAKAVVDVPSPFIGTIIKLYGEDGDVIDTDAPLVEFKEKNSINTPDDNASHTVVGEIDEGSDIISETATVAPRESNATQTQEIKANPAVRMFAKKLHIQLEHVIGTGPNGTITKEDVKQASPQADQKKKSISDGKPLRGVRRNMAQVMSKSHKHVVPVTLVDDAFIAHWKKDEDITLRIIKAISKAVEHEPNLNSSFDGENIKFNNKVNLGIALDGKDGLFVPVIKDIEGLLKNDQIRDKIESFKTGIKKRSLTPEDFKGTTITLSNFGMIAGRYATAIIVPPQVAILGVGKMRDLVVPKGKNCIVSKALPLSLVFDHRVITGGEAARFLRVLIDVLES